MMQRPCICIVDDNEAMRQSLSDFLAKERYQILTFSRGTDLLAYDKEPLPDVILLDVMMPGMDGFTVCAHLKERTGWQHIPVILVTALGDRKNMIRGLEAGAEEYLSKPVNGIELRARVRSMLRVKQQYDQLQNTLKIREKLANMTVHDLRQPINVALMRSSLIQYRKQLATEDEDDLLIIHTQLRRINSLANDILMAAKMDRGQFVLDSALVSLKQLIRKLQPDYELLAKVVNVALLVDVPDEDRLCLLDANLLVRLVDNLVSNAIKFSPEGSEIILRLTYPPGGECEVRLEVIDQGSGIPVEYRDEIFDEYRILAMREKSGPQIGLGLPLCKMVAEAHNGRISVDANQPNGTIFTVDLLRDPASMPKNT